MEKNTVNITRFIKEEKGQLFDLNPIKKGETSNEIIAIKPKSYNGSAEKLNEKYGYYKSLNPAYFIYVEHKEKNKIIRSFERVNLVDVNKIKDEKSLIKYLIENKGLIEPKVIKKVYKDQCLLINGFPYLLIGINSKKELEFKNNKVLYLDKKYEKILKNVIKFLEDNQEKSEENYKFIYLKKRDRNEKNETIDSAKERYNIEFNEMYDKFLEKLDSKDYKNYMNNERYKELLEKKDKFIKLNLLDKAFTLKSFLDLFNKKTMADFSKVGLTKYLGKLNGRSSKALSSKELYLIEESVTGLFVKKIKL